MSKSFEWDAGKAASNRKKHGVSFDEATEVFDDPLSSTIPDPRQRVDERRFVTIGHSRQGRLLVVIHTDRGDTIRLISTRPVTPGERRTYEHQEPS